MTTQQSVYLKRTVHELLILWLSHEFLIWFGNAVFLASNISERLPINGKRKVNFSHYSLSAILLDKNKKAASEVDHFSPRQFSRGSVTFLNLKTWSSFHVYTLMEEMKITWFPQMLFLMFEWHGNELVRN